MKAQAFKKGDFLINANYGQPNVAAYYQKYLYEKKIDNAFFYGGFQSTNFSSTGTFNVKIEYAISDKLGLGISAGFWNYKSEEIFYYWEHRMASLGAKHIELNKEKVKYMPMTVRLNYHIWRNSKWTTYMGFALGLTRITYDQQRYSLDSGEPIVLGSNKDADDILPAGTLTFGLRYYPVSWFGLNFEAGYDSGALLSGGLVFRHPSKNKSEAK